MTIDPSPLEWYVQLQRRVDRFHAFTLGDRAALYDFPTNPYQGHNTDLALMWELGRRGFPFPERETEVHDV